MFFFLFSFFIFMGKGSSEAPPMLIKRLCHVLFFRFHSVHTIKGLFKEKDNEHICLYINARTLPLSQQKNTHTHMIVYLISKTIWLVGDFFLFIT